MNPMRTPLGLALLIMLCWPAGPAQAAQEQQVTQQQRPNILFLFSDDHAPHAIGAYGGFLARVNPTPNIDSLAADGLLFRNSFCSNAICGPSRAVIITGLHSHRNGFKDNGDEFDGDQTTFPKLLQAAGYRTALFGKWHLKSEPQGFDQWEILPGQGNYYNPVFLGPSGKRQIEGHCTDIITDLAIQWLEDNQDSDQPFLLMAQHKAPHRNWMPAQRHLDLWDDVLLPEPATLFDEHLDDASPARHQEMEIDRHMTFGYDLFAGRFDESEAERDGAEFLKLPRLTEAQRRDWVQAFDEENAAFLRERPQGKALVRWKYQRYMKNYLRCVRGVDESVGRLLDYLDRSGLAENTIVVYSSDQGFYLGEHGWFDKRWMFDESMGMPLIVRWPGVTRPGSVNTDLVQNLDYAPTFLEAAGVPIPPAMQGRSLLPLLAGQTPPDWRDALYYHYYAFPSVHMVARHYGLRTQRYKLIHYYQFDEWELFDLEQDPDELHNLFGDPAHLNLALRLSERLGRLREAYGDDSDTSPMPPQWRAKYRPR